MQLAAPMTVETAHQGVTVAAAVLLGSRGQVPGVADGQRLEPDQGAFQNRHLQPRVHQGVPQSLLRWS